MPETENRTRSTKARVAIAQWEQMEYQAVALKQSLYIIGYTFLPEKGETSSMTVDVYA